MKGMVGECVSACVRGCVCTLGQAKAMNEWLARASEARRISTARRPVELKAFKSRPSLTDPTRKWGST